MLYQSLRKEQLHDSMGASIWRVRMHSMHQVIGCLGRNALSEGTILDTAARLAYLVTESVVSLEIR